MTAHLLVAPPASGKTDFCLRLVLDTLRAAPFSRVSVIVPDRQQAAAFRRRLAAAGGSLGGRVDTFEDVYREVLARAGQSLPQVSDNAQHRLARAALEEAAASEQLKLFGGLSSRPGLPAALLERFRELKWALVTPEQVEALARREEDIALLDLARVYAGYQRRLQEMNWADEEGLSWLAYEALRANPCLLADWPLLLVDGFDSFNAAQVRTLLVLSSCLPEVWITLPGQPDSHREAHRRFQRPYHDLTTRLTLSVETLPPVARLPGCLASLEQELFEPRPEPASGGPELDLLEASSPAEEAREALRWVKMRLLRGRLLPSACAVIVPDLEGYRGMLRAAGEEFGLRLRFPAGLPLLEAPAVAALLDMLRMPLAGFPQRPLLDLLRSPFFDFSFCGLAREDADALEMAGRYGQVVEGLLPWQEVLRELSRREAPAAPEADDEDLEESLPAPRLPTGAEAARLLAGLNALAARVTPPEQLQSMRQWAGWLADLLSEMSFLSGDDPQDARLADTLTGLLVTLVSSEALAGDIPVGAQVFVSQVEALLGGSCLTDENRDGEAVTVLNISTARGLRFEAVVVMGLSEGSFPRVERSDPFLSEAVRAELAMPPQLGQYQNGLFYEAVTRANHWLLLTRPYLADNGEGWEPSTFWNAVRACVAVEPRRIHPDDRRPLGEAASAGELLFWASRRFALTGRGLDEAFAQQWLPRWHALERPRETLRARLQKQASGPFDGGVEALEADLNTRFGSQMIWSVSRLESYTTCPFYFFTDTALRLEVLNPPQVGLDVAQRGSILHAVLEQVYRLSADPGDLQEVLAKLPAVAQRVFASAPAKMGFRPGPLWEREQAELLQTLAENITRLADMCADGGWQPLAFECAYGMEDQPPLQIDLECGPVRLRGKIDRVDRAPDGRVRVIDYKSGSSHQTRTDLVEGRRLQLPLYALAAREALGLGDAADGFYWPLFARNRPSPLRLGQFESETGSGVEAAIDVACQHVQRAVIAVRGGSFAPQPPADGCPQYCPAAAWCWHFHKGR